MTGRQRNLLFWIVVLCIGIAVGMPQRIFAQTEETVTIGYYEKQGFQEGCSDTAVKSGYSYEYVQKIASYTGWQYTYVYGTWEELYQKLLDGEIDLLAGVSYKQEREQEISYPAMEMINETYYIYKDEEDASIEWGNIESFSGKKIGLSGQNEQMAEKLKIWKEENHADIEVLFYDTMEDCAEAFNQEKIDAFVSADNVVSSYTGIVPVEKIGKEPYYLCVSKNRKDLLEKLNTALAIMNEQDAVELAELHNKYSAETTVSVFLSDQERDWMENHKKITVGYMNYYLPYSDTDENGEPTGIISDVVTEMFQVLPGDYEPEIVYQAYNSQKDMMQGLKDGDVDFVFPVDGEEWYAEQEGYQQSSAVITSAMDLVYREPYSEASTSRIAVNENNLLQYNYIKKNFPDAELVMYDSIESCIRAVYRGSVDSTVINALRSYQIVGAEKNIGISPLAEEADRCFAVRFGDNELLRILNHGLSILGTNYGLNHAYPYIENIATYTAEDFIHDNLGSIASAIGVILFLLVIAFAKHDQEMRKIAQKEVKQKKELEEALEAAREAGMARTVFLRNMSHDIRTPMNAVLGFTDLAMKEDTDPQKIQEYLKKIQISGKHLLAIVNEVLEISRIESGQTELCEEPADMDDIIEEVAVIIREQTQEKNQQFVIELSGIQNHEILCDKLRIKEILVNLLGNAVKFTPQEGTITLQIVQIPPYEKEIGHYEFHVKDNGCGMSPSFMEKMFEPFEREKNSTLSGVQGTGLGLPIVKRFVDLMEGTIDVISKEGVGTEFIIKADYLLVSRALLETANRQSTVSRKRQITGKRILLAEDNELNREIAATLLQDAGFEVEEAENGAQAVERIKHAAPDTYAVILMDIQMPIMDGYTATRQIRQLEDPSLANIPIIAISANAFEEDKEASQAAGMNGHLAKPMDAEAVLAMLEEVLGGKES